MAVSPADNQAKLRQAIDIMIKNTVAAGLHNPKSA
jgi:hypothetical protein